MKVTKRQLKRIIREEKAKLQEAGFHSRPNVNLTWSAEDNPQDDDGLEQHHSLMFELEGILEDFKSKGLTKEDVLEAIAGIYP